MQFRYVVTGLVVVMSLAGCQRTSYAVSYTHLTLPTICSV